MSRQPLTWSSVLLAGVLSLPAQGRAEPVETLLHDFFARTGSLQQAPLIYAGDGNLYGTASGGPRSGAHCGTIYRQTSTA